MSAAAKRMNSFLLQPPEFLKQVLRRRGWLVAVKIFVGQNFVAELRAVFPTDDGLGDFPLQEGRDVLSVGDVFVVLDVVVVGPFHGEDGQVVRHQRLEFFGGIVLRREDKFADMRHGCALTPGGRGG